MSANQNYGCIYCLIDPRDSRIRYVGQTVRPLVVRLKGHIRDGISRPKVEWIKELLALGLRPIIIPIEMTAINDLNNRELYWINKLIQSGAKLTNTKLYKRGIYITSRPLKKPQIAPSPMAINQTVDLWADGLTYVYTEIDGYFLLITKLPQSDYGWAVYWLEKAVMLLVTNGITPTYTIAFQNGLSVIQFDIDNVGRRN